MGEMKVASRIRHWFRYPERQVLFLLSRIRHWFRYPERQVLFLLGSIYSNRLAKYVLSILVTFLTRTWRLKLKQAVAIMNIQGGAAGIMEIPVAFLIDAYVGNYWMLVSTTVLYCIGLGLLTVSVPPYFFNGKKMCPAEQDVCASKLKASPFSEALLLIVLARAGQGISLKALSFDKITDVRTPRDQRQMKSIEFPCFQFKVVKGERRYQKLFISTACYVIAIAGSITGIMGIVYLGHDWSSRFKISACVMATGIVVFFVGVPIYDTVQVPGSPLSDMFRVVVAAALKRHHTPPVEDHHSQLDHGNSDQEHKSTLTDHLRFLNKAAIRESNNQDESRWRLCTVKQVEDTKLLLSMLPMAATFLLYGMIKSNSDTFFIVQGQRMNRELGSIKKVSLAFFLFLSESFQFVVKTLYKRIFAKRVEESKKRYSDGLKIGLGMLAALFCCAVASWVETKRLKSLKHHGLLNQPQAIAPMSIFWLTPQFLLIGAMDGLARDGIENFFEHQVPISVRKYGSVFTNCVIGWGKILNVGFVILMDKIVAYKGESSWIADSINESRLDHFYRALVAVSLLNLLIYAYVASRYSYKDATQALQEEKHAEIPEMVNLTPLPPSITFRVF